MPLIVPPDRKLPWFDAALLVANHVPYVQKDCLRGEDGRRRNVTTRNTLYGMCYTASEALYHLSEDPLVPHWVRYGPEKHETHWYLRLPQEENRVVDMTASQFSDWDLYSLYEWGRPRPFGTTYPSKRATLVLERILDSGAYTQNVDRFGLVDDHQEYLAIRKRKRKAENSNPTPSRVRSG